MSAYKRALADARKVGSAHATDAQLMAQFCESAIQILVGAASPELVWDGAQRRGMTTKTLNDLALRDPIAVHELMWS